MSEPQAHPLKNNALAFAADWMVVPETLEAAKDSLNIIEDFYKQDGLVDPKPTALRELCDEPIKEVYTIPLFSEAFCSMLLDEVQSMEFIPNAAEDEARQMPEIVLHERLPTVHNSISEVVARVVNPVLASLWMRPVSHAHIQVANYNPREKKQGAWHHDESADITIVVPLNTGAYTGGGTEFLHRGVVQPLPNGTALIFPSLTHMHRGLPVEEGDRFLLVFWLTCKERDA